MKKLKYILLMVFTLGLMAISCNEDPVKPLQGGGEDDDPPIILDSTSVHIDIPTLGQESK